MKTRRVLHVIKGLGRGGAERLLVSTIRQHSKHYQFDVVYFLPRKNQLVPDLQAIGCSVVCLPSSNVLQILMNVPTLLRLMRKEKYDIIHAHLPWACIAARIATRFAKIPLVYTEHNIFDEYKIPTRFFHKLIFGWMQYVIAVSGEVENAIRKEVHPKARVRTISNGVDTQALDRSLYNVASLKEKYFLDPNALIIGTVAVFRQQKRLDRWLRIAEQVSQQFPQVYFIVVGEGLLRSDLERQGSALIKNKKLHFAGLSAEPDGWMACMDIYLMSSDFEGLPVALLEAMSMQCVPVVTRAGGIPSVIDHSENGFLYQQEDEAQAVLFVGDLVCNIEKRQKMGVSARAKIVGSFGIKKMVESIEEVYEDVA